MKIIDSHVHIGLNKFCLNQERALPYDLENSYEKYIKIMQEVGIEKACIIPIPDAGYDIRLSNKYLEEAALYSNEKLLPICRLDNMLANNISGAFLGAKYHKLYENIPKARLEEYLKILEYYRTPLIIHAAFKDKAKQVKYILKIAPNLVVVLAHMGRGHLYTSEQVEDNLTALKPYENVLFETSTVGNSDTVKLACNIVGSDRVMFGSDYPFGRAYQGETYSYADELNVVLNADISESEKENVLYNTAYRTFVNDNKNKDKNKNDFYITQYSMEYKDEFEQMLKSLDKQDKNFLALEHKISVIKDCMRKERHLYVIIYQGKFAGYFRESGRPNGYSLLEELVILPECRGKGLSKKTLEFYKHLYPLSYAKTNGKNDIMNSLLKKQGYRCINGERILNWEYDGGSSN